MNSRNTKIGKIINEMFDSRTELMVFSYIMDAGINKIEAYTDEDISKVEGNGLMTKEFCQALIRTAREICKECTPTEIMEYIRLHLYFTPAVHELEIYRDDFKNRWRFEDILDDLNLDNEEVGSTLTIYAIVDESKLKQDEE